MGLAQVEILCYDKLDKIFKGGLPFRLETNRKANLWQKAFRGCKPQKINL